MQPSQNKQRLIDQMPGYQFDQMEEIHPQLREFIVDYCTKYKIRRVDPHALNLETSIDMDLDIFDIEIDLFLAEFAEQFSVDNSKFSWYKYGYPTGSASVSVIKSIFGHKATWVKRLAGHLYKPKFKVSHLQDAMRTGKLL